MNRTPFSKTPQWAQWSQRKGNIICTMVKYGETFYCCHTTLKYQLKCSKINVKKIAFGNKEHTTDKKMGVSVLLWLFISSNEVKSPEKKYVQRRLRSTDTSAQSDQSRHCLHRLATSRISKLFSSISYNYSRTPAARTPFGQWKSVRGMGSLSQWRLIMAPGREANIANSGKSIDLLHNNYVECIH